MLTALSTNPDLDMFLKKDLLVSTKNYVNVNVNVHVHLSLYVWDAPIVSMRNVKFICVPDPMFNVIIKLSRSPGTASVTTQFI